MKRLSPFAVSTLVLGAMTAAGGAAVLAAAASMRGVRTVVQQMPYAVSGVMGGLALVAFSLGLIAVQATRRREAIERAEFARLVTAAAGLLHVAQSEGDR